MFLSFRSPANCAQKGRAPRARMTATNQSQTSDSSVNVASSVNYSKPPTGERLYVKVPSLETNLQHVPTTVTVTSSRGFSTSLDKEGFESHYAPSRVQSWDSEEQVVNVCYVEAVELVKKATGAKSAAVFDHTIRRAKGSSTRKLISRDPVFSVHADYTVPSAHKRLEDFYGERAVELKQGRWAIFNVWRPISGIVHDLPLGFVDVTTLSKNDLHAYDLIYPDRVGGNLTVSYNPDHRWFFYPHQTPDEVHIFKQFDSREDVARFTPHTAFEDPTKPAEGYLPRESIELRLFVFYDIDLGLPVIAKAPEKGSV